MALQQFGEFFIDVDGKGIAQCFSYSFHDFLQRSQELTKLGATLILDGRLFPSTGGGYHAFYQLPIDKDHKLDFKYTFKYWNLSDPKMREWKRFKDQNPLVGTDYEVWTEKQGVADRIKFSPCRGDAKWMTKGSTLLSKIVKEGSKFWDEAGKKIGKDLSIQDIDTMFGQNSGRRSTASEKNFSQLLGGN